ncbi:MAG: c-type cytochrome biogenesis protein CcsB [Beutenbergiaceae bacterium]
MAEMSDLLVLGALAAYLSALVFFAVDLSALGGRAGAPKVRRSGNIAVTLSWLGLSLHGVALVTRGIAAARVPWANMYEFTLTFTLVAVAVFLLVQRRRDVRYLGVIVMAVAVAALALALFTLYVPADGVQPALDSVWLVIHVSIAAASTGLFTVAAAAAVLQLLQHRRAGRAPATVPALVGATVDESAPAEGPSDADSSAAVPASEDGSKAAPSTFLGRMLAQLPNAEKVERFTYRLNAVGFVGWTFTVLAGAVWAEQAWGRPWGWDPKETWSLVIWLIYAAYLHMRATVGWTINRFAWFTLLGFLALMANFYIVNIFFSGNHSYSGL